VNQQPRDESGRFAPRETGEEAAPAADDSAPPAEQQINDPMQGQLAALKDERRKRQELERLVQQYQQSQPAPEVQSPDFWENPDAALNQRFQEFGTQLMQQMQTAQWQERTTASEAAAKAKHADFDDKIELFHSLAERDPTLVNELRRSNDPAEFAYAKASEAMLLQQHGSVDALLKAKRAEWEAEIKGSIPTLQMPPSSTASERSVAARSGPNWGGPKSLADIIGG
ncbi:MAG: hypothetical protein ACREUQ_10130, partial [Burkholderiales bacterium]